MSGYVKAGATFLKKFTKRWKTKNNWYRSY